MQYVAAAAKSLQSRPTLCDPIDSSPPGSPVPGILQARTVEWVAISFSNAWKWKVKVMLLSRVLLFAAVWTAAYQAPPSMDFPGKSTRVGCHCLLRHASLESYLLHAHFFCVQPANSQPEHDPAALTRVESVSHSVVSDSSWPHGL